MRWTAEDRLDQPLTDHSRLEAACRLDRMGVEVMRRAAAAGVARVPGPVLTLFVAGPDGVERPAAYADLRRIRAEAGGQTLMLTRLTAALSVDPEPGPENDLEKDLAKDLAKDLKNGLENGLENAPETTS